MRSKLCLVAVPLALAIAALPLALLGISMGRSSTVEIVVPVAAIPADTIVAPAMLRVATWPETALFAGIVTEPGQIVGRSTHIELAADAPISEHALGGALATIEIIVPIAPIAPGTIVGPEMLRAQRWPANAAFRGLVTEASQIVGRRALIELTPDAPVSEGALATP